MRDKLIAENFNDVGSPQLVLGSRYWFASNCSDINGKYVYLIPKNNANTTTSICKAITQKFIANGFKDSETEKISPSCERTLKNSDERDDPTLQMTRDSVGRWNDFHKSPSSNTELAVKPKYSHYDLYVQIYDSNYANRYTPELKALNSPNGSIVVEVKYDLTFDNATREVDFSWESIRDDKPGYCQADLYKIEENKPLFHF